MQDFVPVPFPADAGSGWGFGQSDRIRVSGHGMRAGKTGTVVAWGRSVQADQHWRQFHQSDHVLDQGCRWGKDCDALVDAEGPVVRYDDGETDWWPGQSMGVLEPEGDQPKSMSAKAVMRAIGAVLNGNMARQGRFLAASKSERWVTAIAEEADDLPILGYEIESGQPFAIEVVRYGEDLAGGVDLALRMLADPDEPGVSELTARLAKVDETDQKVMRSLVYTQFAEAVWDDPAEGAVITKVEQPGDGSTAVVTMKVGEEERTYQVQATRLAGTVRPKVIGTDTRGPF